MCSRPVDDGNIWAIKQNLRRLYLKQVRISDQIKELTQLLKDYDADQKCWSCESWNTETTDLTECQVVNMAYPLACNYFKGE